MQGWWLPVVLAAASQFLQPGLSRLGDTRLSTEPFRPDALIFFFFFFSLPKGPDVILGTARKGQESGRSYFHCSPSLAHSHPSDLALEPSIASPPTCSPHPHPQALPWVSTVCVNV